MTQETTQGPDDDILAILRDIQRRLTKIEETATPDGHPFRSPGQRISEGEYKRRTGIPRVAAAIALNLLGMSQEETARMIGVNRRTLQVGLEFQEYRNAIISLGQGGFERKSRKSKTDD